MRQLTKFFACTLAITAFAACGGSGDDDNGDDDDAPDASTTPQPDADTTPSPDAMPNTTNALGQVCDSATPCPDGNSCTGIQGVGSETSGYCSPACTPSGGECAAGYTGPAGGQPMCVLSEAAGADPTLCAIICTDNAQCPSGTQCIPVPGNSASVCAPPA